MAAKFIDDGVVLTDEQVVVETQTDIPVIRKADRLLASPRYGEHMARFWLDAARYAALQQQQSLRASDQGSSRSLRRCLGVPKVHDSHWL